MKSLNTAQDTKGKMHMYRSLRIASTDDVVLQVNAADGDITPTIEAGEITTTGRFQDSEAVDSIAGYLRRTAPMYAGTGQATVRDAITGYGMEIVAREDEVTISIVDGTTRYGPTFRVPRTSMSDWSPADTLANELANANKMLIRNERRRDTLDEPNDLSVYEDEFAKHATYLRQNSGKLAGIGELMRRVIRANQP